MRHSPWTQGGESKFELVAAAAIAVADHRKPENESAIVPNGNHLRFGQIRIQTGTGGLGLDDFYKAPPRSKPKAVVAVLTNYDRASPAWFRN